MDIIKEEIIEIDGNKYKQTTFSNGTIETVLLNENVINVISEEDEAMLEMQMNIEYLVALQEINMM